MTLPPAAPVTLPLIDDATRQLVRVAAVVAAGDEAQIRATLGEVTVDVPVPWVEEVLLQSHLFAGFPRALNAMREWRRIAGPFVAAAADRDTAAPGATPDLVDRRRAGEATCRAVYGSMYERLRENIRALHPALDEWMIIDGYGSALSRPGLDLPRRELCIVAACVASGQERQLHSHLHGALNVGAGAVAIAQTLDALEAIVDASRLRDARLLFARLTAR